jgi:hypothetical protein
VQWQFAHMICEVRLRLEDHCRADWCIRRTLVRFWTELPDILTEILVVFLFPPDISMPVKIKVRNYRGSSSCELQLFLLLLCKMGGYSKMGCYCLIPYPYVLTILDDVPVFFFFWLYTIIAVGSVQLNHLRIDLSQT